MASGVSETDIYNRALSKIGSRRVTSTAEDVERVRVLNDMYAIVRDSVMRENPWNHTVKRDILAKDGTDPVWEWDNRYQLPTDFLLLLDIEEQPAYNIEGGFIYTDDGDTLKIKYVSRSTQTAQYDALFVEALASKLAFEACFRITHSNTLKESLRVDFERAIAEAKMRDGFEDDPQEPIEDDWVLSRR